MDDDGRSVPGALTVNWSYYDITTGERIPDSEVQAKHWDTTLSNTMDENYAAHSRWAGWCLRLTNAARSQNTGTWFANGENCRLPAGGTMSLTFDPSVSVTPVSMPAGYTQNGNTYSGTMDSLHKAHPD